MTAVFILSLLCKWEIACEAPPPPLPPPPPHFPAPIEPPPALAVDEPAAEVPCLKIDRIEIWKQEHTLRAYCNRGAVVAMSVAIGREEIGPKTRSGDHRTPEGTYRISGAPKPGRFHLFIPIDYPSRLDADRARADGRLGERDYERIVTAHDAGRPPPADTSLGGDLGFHGEGKRWRGNSEDFDWTYGCIAVTDPEIEFLSEHVEIGIPVLIHP